MNKDVVSREFFDDLYKADPDPWRFASSDYELDRYRAILDALPMERYNRAFEPGCSIGVLTAQLAKVCDRVVAMDLSPVAIERATLRCAELLNVSLSCGALPADLPVGQFDLIVFSEMGYYFQTDQLRSLVNMLVSRMETGATFLSCHWLGTSSDHILSGNRVHELIGTIAGLDQEYSAIYEGFRLDRWVRQ